MKCTSARDCAGKEANFVQDEGEVGSWFGKTHRFCLDKRLWDVWGGGRVLLLDVCVEMEIIDFLLPRIKKKVRKYHNYTRLCSTFIAFPRE